MLTRFKHICGLLTKPLISKTLILQDIVKTCFTLDKTFYLNIWMYLKNNGIEFLYLQNFILDITIFLNKAKL